MGQNDVLSLHLGCFRYPIDWIIFVNVPFKRIFDDILSYCIKRFFIVDYMVVERALKGKGKIVKS